MQCIRLSVPQKLYDDLGLCENKTLVLKSWRKDSKPNSVGSRSILKSSVAAGACDMPSVSAVPQIDEGKETPDKCDISDSMCMNDSDEVRKIIREPITYPRVCRICNHVCNSKSGYFKHRKKCLTKAGGVSTSYAKSNIAYDDSSDAGGVNTSYTKSNIAYDDCSDAGGVNTSYTKSNIAYHDDSSDAGGVNTRYTKCNIAHHDDSSDAGRVKSTRYKKSKTTRPADVTLEELEALGFDPTKWKNKNADCDVEQQTVDIYRTCTNCCRSYCTQNSFERHLPQCAQFKKIGTPKQCSLRLPFGQRRPPRADNPLDQVIKMSSSSKQEILDSTEEPLEEDKTAKWIPVELKPKKPMKFFVVKKTPA